MSYFDPKEQLSRRLHVLNQEIAARQQERRVIKLRLNNIVRKEAKARQRKMA